MTNQTYTREQLNERYLRLPEELKEALSSDELLDAIAEIGRKHKLHVDQQGVLAEEIGLVFLGVAELESLLPDLQEKLNISIDEAGEIVKDVNTLVFFPIRETLQSTNEQKNKDLYQPEQAPLVENFSPVGNVSEMNIPKPETPLPVPDNNAIIINRKEAAEKEEDAEKKLFEEKMGKLFRLPKEEVEITNKAQPKTIDPYHEQI